MIIYTTIIHSRWSFRRVTNNRERQRIRSLLGGYLQPNCQSPRTAAMHGGLVLNVQTIGSGAVNRRSNGNSAQSTYPNAWGKKCVAARDKHSRAIAESTTKASPTQVQASVSQATQCGNEHCLKAQPKPPRGRVPRGMNIGTR